MIHPSRQSYVTHEPPPGQIALEDLPTDYSYDPLTGASLPSTGVAPERASAILSQFSRRRRAAAIAVPTDDGRVRTRLRELREPITVFGEGAAERRDRLREVLVRLEEQRGGADGDVAMRDADGKDPDAQGGDADAEEGEEGGEEEEGEFYEIGTPALLHARRFLATYSLPRTRARQQAEKLLATVPQKRHAENRREVKRHLLGFEDVGTQTVGDRPVSTVRFSPDSRLVVAGNWAGGLRVLRTEGLEPLAGGLEGHEGRIGGVDWLPGADTGGNGEGLALASGGGEGSVKLWSLNRRGPLATLEGHSARVCRVAFHPSGRFLASASFDTTWRLWDLEAQTAVLTSSSTSTPAPALCPTSILTQEGHSRELYTTAFSPLGSLLASAGLDSIGRIWDLRTGRTVMILDGHSREIYALDWAVDGHRLLSGGGDGWVKAWDLRRPGKAVGAVGAHRGVVSDLRCFRGRGGVDAGGMQLVAGNGLQRDAVGRVRPGREGTFFVTGGFDREVNVFGADDWGLVRTLSGHSGNVLGVDVSGDGRWIVSCGHDRTVKLWGREDGEGL